MSNTSTRIERLLSFKFTYGIILGVLFAVAFSLRVCLPYDTVFEGDWVRFTENDPWYHLRLVENLLHHFPFRISFDTYTLYPYGQAVFFAPLFDLLVGFSAWVVGLGSPSQYTIEIVGAYFPAILGALVTLPVYFIGKELFNRNAGLLSAALIAIMPGDFLFRSLLGFTDHHVAEVLFSTVTILFLILALKRAKEKETSFDHIRHKEWGNIRQPLIYALLTGVALGAYLLSWVGGALFVLILFSCLVFLYILDHLRGRSTDYLCIIGLPIFVVSLIMLIPFLNQLAFRQVTVMALILATLTFPVLSVVSRLMVYRKASPAYYPLALAGMALVAAILFWLVDPSLFHSMLDKFGVFSPSVTSRTISEARPLFADFDISSLTEQPAWHYFGTGLFIAPIALLLVAYTAIKEQRAEKILLVIWSVIALAAMLGQVRFAYYFAVNAALLVGYFCWRIPGWISATLSRLGFRESPEPEAEKVKEKKRKKKGRSLKGKETRTRRGALLPQGFAARYLKPRYVSGALAVIVVFFLAFFPLFGLTPHVGENLPGPNADWHSALVWMRDNTPDPFQDLGDPDFYYELYQRPLKREDGYPQYQYEYPESAYGVMSWWDYGHWITALAHRIPNSNPHQLGAVDAAQFFTAQEESVANEILDRLGSRYIIIDVKMATPFRIVDGRMFIGGFRNMIVWAGEEESKFYEIYYRIVEGQRQAVPIYYPEYYQSMCVRLYLFGGEQVMPVNSTWVITYTESEGYRIISDTKLFPTYWQAEEYLASQSSPNCRIVGFSPFYSPVPLGELGDYELVYHSDSPGAKVGDKTIAYHVEIFKYQKSQGESE